MNFFLKLILLFGFSAFIFAASDELAVENAEVKTPPPKRGNFTLPVSQQPGPFLSFGQTLIGRNYLQLSFASFSPYHNISKPFNNLNAALTYGITDNTSVNFNFPITSDSNVRTHSFHGNSSGLRDCSLQLEQALYSAGNSKYQDQVTVVGTITLPTQEISTIKTPSGYGSPSYFVGTTFNRTLVDWLGFFSPGALFTTSRDGIQLGSQWMYQAGLGRNILYVSGQSTLFGLLELDGQFTAKNRVFGRDSVNSGGNVVALTPSLTLATRNLMAQVGVGFPVIQHLNGSQKNTNYFIAAELLWTIH